MPAGSAVRRRHPAQQAGKHARRVRKLPLDTFVPATEQFTKLREVAARYAASVRGVASWLSSEAYIPCTAAMTTCKKV